MIGNVAARLVTRLFQISAFLVTVAHRGMGKVTAIAGFLQLFARFVKCMTMHCHHLITRQINPKKHWKRMVAVAVNAAPRHMGILT